MPRASGFRLIIMPLLNSVFPPYLYPLSHLYFLLLALIGRVPKFVFLVLIIAMADLAHYYISRVKNIPKWPLTSAAAPVLRATAGVLQYYEQSKGSRTLLQCYLRVHFEIRC